MVIPEKPGIDFTLYLITDRKQTRAGNLRAAVEAALRGGVQAVQLREKDLSGRELFNLASGMRELTAGYGARLFINDRLDVAMAVEADGVHLGEESIPADRARDIAGDRLLIGVSCHSLEKSLSARKAGADFITFSPVFFTPSKAQYGEPQGLERLAEVCAAVDIPVFALGGIKMDKVRTVIQRGAAGVALISAILAEKDPELSAVEMLALLKECSRKKDQG